MNGAVSHSIYTFMRFSTWSGCVQSVQEQVTVRTVIELHRLTGKAGSPRAPYGRAHSPLHATVPKALIGKPATPCFPAGLRYCVCALVPRCNATAAAQRDARQWQDPSSWNLPLTRARGTEGRHGVISPP